MSVPGFRVRQASILALAINMAFSGIVHAGPQGAAVVSGQVTITNPHAGTTQIQASNGAIINWQNFSIGAGETTRFVQPSASAAVLNRVVGPQASQLLGQLQANGRVFLINPNGIAIGAGARIDTNGFIASTLNIADADFLAGKLRFFANGQAAGLTNRGLITVAPGGQVALIAPTVENSGVIHAPDGQILLAAGHRIEIASLDFDNITFEVQAPTDSVLNLGKLLAENGAIRVFAGNLRHEGEIRANAMVQDADGSIRLVGTSELALAAGSVTRADGVAGGVIQIESPQGTTRVAGEVSALGVTGTGGSIRVLGERVALAAGSIVDASGASGGGEVLVGGDFQGANAAVQNAQRVHVGEGAQLKADALEQGDGGRIIVWADENTRYFGDLSARGGHAGGDGGFAEVSGKQNLDFQGRADLTAANGAAGTLLLDPLDIIVSANGARLSTVLDEFSDFQTNVITVSPTAINQIGGNVVLQADRDIHFNTPTNFTGTSLTASAGSATPGGAIFLNHDLTTSGGAVNLNGATISGIGGIATSGGAVTLTAANGLNYASAIRSGGGAVTATATAGSINSLNVDAGAGSVSLTAQAGNLSGNQLAGGVLTLNSSGSQNNTVSAASRVDAASSNSSVSLSTSGQPLRIGTVSAAGTVSLFSAAGGVTQVSGGRVTAPQVSVYSNDSAAGVGSAAAPLNLETAQLGLYGLVAPAFVNVSGTSTLNGLWLEGSLAGLSGSLLTGSANLTNFALSSGPGGLNLSAAATGGFANGLELTVRDAGIVVPQLSVPGPVSFEVAGPATFGNVTVGDFDLTATEAVNITSVTTSNGGIDISTGRCPDWQTDCTAQSPVTLGALTTSAGGRVDVFSTDNGNISIASINAGGSVDISAGDFWDADSAPRNVAVTLGATTAGGSVSIQNQGSGDVVLNDTLTAASGATFNVLHGQLNVQNLNTGAGSIYAMVEKDILFSTLTASGVGDVDLSSSSGWIRTRNTTPAADIVSGRDVNLYTGNALASGIGNPAFANPLDIKAGVDGSVGLYSASSVGAPGRPVNVDVQKGISVESGQGQFHVAARNPAGELQSVRNIHLGAIPDAVGAGNNVTFVSQALNVVGASDGTAINIGDIVQTTGTLDSFSFSSGGNSESGGGAGDLIFGLVNLATTGETGHPGYAGFNQLSLRAADNLIQTDAATNSISAGNTSLDSGASTTVGDVNILQVAGNSLSGSAGGDFLAGNLNAPSLTVFAENIGVGGVTTSGTNRSRNTPQVYVPRLNRTQYITDELRLSARGSLLTLGNIASQTSVLLDAVAGMAVVGGAGNITGGNTAGSFYTDTVRVDAGSGMMAAADIAAHTVRIEGDTLNVNRVEATGGALRVTGANFATGDLVAARDLTINASDMYVPGAIAISAGNNSTATVNAPNGIELDNASFSANFVYLNAGEGSVSGNLTGARTLDVLAGGSINLMTDQALTSLTLQAKGSAFGPASVISGSGQLFEFTTLGGDNAALAFNSPSTGISLRYTERSSAAELTHIDLAANLGSGALIVGAGPASLSANNVMSNGSVFLSSAGTMHLGNVATTQGNISAESSAGELTLDSVSSGGSSVTLVSGQGDIRRSGAGTIDAGNAGVPSGTVSLRAASGRVGEAATPVTVSNARSLVLEAKDDIAVDMAGTILTNLQITTGATGAGNISLLNNPGYAGFSLTRAGGTELLLGPVQQNAGSFTLNATDGGIRVAGDMALSALTLDARATGADIVIAADGGPRSLTVTGAFNARAGQDLLIQSGDDATETVRLLTGGANLSADRDLKMQANAATLEVTSTGSQSFSAGRHLDVLGGTSAGASAIINARFSQSLQARSSDPAGNMMIAAGAGYAALVRVQAGGSQTVRAQDFSLLGGSDGETSAELLGQSQNLANVHGALTVKAGNSLDAFAEIRATGSQTIGNQNQWFSDPTDSVTVQGGNQSGAYARIASGSSQSVFSIGNIEVLGGQGAGAYAEISSAGSQTLGSTNTIYTGPTLNILVQAGSGGVALVRSQGSQTVRASGDIVVSGGTGANMTAGIESITGSQNIGNTATVSNDPTDNVFVRAGSEDGASAWLRAGSGQTVDAAQAIEVVGSANKAALAEISQSGSVATQTIGNRNAGGDPTDRITVTGGGVAGASASIFSAGQQILRTVGMIAIKNPGSDAARITAVGNQVAAASAIEVALNSSVNGTPLAELRSDADQTMTLDGGVGAGAGAASLTIANTSTTAGSLAQIKAGGAQQVLMPYDERAGRLLVGGTATTGSSLLSAGGAQTLVVGDVLVQGGATPAGSAKILAVGDGNISAINGSISVLGGLAGPAAIDPPNLNLVSNGNIVVQAGTQATATALIQGGNVNIAATAGNIQTTGGAAAGATASIAANGAAPGGNLNLFSSGNVAFTPNAGGATATAPGNTNVFALGQCVGCGPALIGPGPVNIQVGAIVNPVGTVALVDPTTGDILAMLDSIQDFFGMMTINEDGEIVIDPTRRRLPRCS